MSLTVNTQEFNLLRDLIRNECGIEIQDNKMYLIEGRLAQLVIESGCQSFMEFYEKASKHTDDKLREKIVDAITTNETLWFRDQAPFTTLTEVIFPELFKALESGKEHEIRIWSAASSTGQEAYSIAILADQFAAKYGYGSFLRTGRFKILGTDISQSALMLARLARYDSLAMSRGMPPELQERYFTTQGNISVLKDEIKKLVTFEKFNIMDSFSGLGKFNIVFLRNVAIYFSDDVKRELLQKVATVIHPNGYFFLGASEFFRDSHENFDTCRNDRCTYYQRNINL